MVWPFSFSLTLTLIRLIGAPFVLPFFLVYLLPFNNFFINTFLVLLFLAFGMTDFLDGYYARKYSEVTALGSTLDHLADKCLLYSTLIALVAAHKIYFMWAVVWIGREFLVMGVRILALEHNFSIFVSAFGKSKTAAQIACLAFIIFNTYQHMGMSAVLWNGIELFLLIVATFLSMWSAYKYCMVFMEKRSF